MLGKKPEVKGMEVISWILLIFVLVILFRSIKIIRQSTVGIIERLGKFHGKAEQAEGRYVS